MVAPLRISRHANSGQTWSSRGTRPASAASTSLRVSAAPTVIASPTVTSRSSGSRSTATTCRRRAPRRLVSTPRSVEPASTTASGCASRTRSAVREVGRALERAVPVRHPGRRGRGRRCGAPGGERVVGGRRLQRLRRVQDRPVAGAAAQVAAERVVPGLGGRARDGPVAPVVLRGHRAHEARRAVAALRPAAHRHLALDGVQRVRLPEALGRHDLLAVEGQRGDQAGVERGPLRRVAVGPGDEDRAGPALALGAALLGAGEARGRAGSPAPTRAPGWSPASAPDR